MKLVILVFYARTNLAGRFVFERKRLIFLSHNLNNRHLFLYQKQKEPLQTQRL